MAYTIESYVALKDPDILKQRFDNLKPLANIVKRERDQVRQIVNNPEHGKALLIGLDARFNDIVQDMNNILAAMKVIELQNSEPEYEDEEDEDDE